MYDLTRHPFIVPSETVLDKLYEHDRFHKQTCGRIACSATHVLGYTGYCEEHALELFDMVIASKGYDYLAARAAGVDMALELEKTRLHAQYVKSEAIALTRVTSAGWVYYILVGDLVKIGWSSELDRRLRTYPPKSELLAIHPGTMATEKDMHRMFRKYLAQGREWFTPCDEITAHVEKVKSQFPQTYKLPKYRENTVVFKQAS